LSGPGATSRRFAYTVGATCARSRIAPIQSFLGLADARMRANRALPASVSVCHIPVRIGCAATMGRVVQPIVSISDGHTVEVIPVDEVVVNDYVVVSPFVTPAPATPSS